MRLEIGPNGLYSDELVGTFRRLLLECGDGAMRIYVHLSAHS